MRAAFGETTVALLDEDPWVALVLADISVSAHFARALVAHPDRAVNVGIMEQTMVGVAAGFAMEGFLPIAHSLSPFMAERPYEQLKLDFGYQGLGGTFVGMGGSYDYAAEGGTHHAPADAALMLAIPDMEVLVPGCGQELATLLRATYANGAPTYVRASTASNPVPFDVVPGRLEVVRRGGAGTLVVFGPMLGRTLEAVGDLDLTVLYATSLRPFGAETLASLAPEAGPVVSVEPWYEGTATHVLAEALAPLALRHVSIGVPRAFIRAYGTAHDIDADLGLDAAGIRRRIVEVLGPG
jgi:transketolase